MKHPMQCAKCFRVCRLSDSGKTWVCTICKHREKANGGQAVSDKLPHVEVHEAMCKSIGDMAKENEALKDRIKRLEEAGDFLSRYLREMPYASDYLAQVDERILRISNWRRAKEDNL